MRRSTAVVLLALAAFAAVLLASCASAQGLTARRALPENMAVDGCRQLNERIKGISGKQPDNVLGK